MMATYPAPGSWYRTLSGTTVEAPVPASSAVSVGGSFSTVTFGAFSDPSSFIDSYSASTLNVNLSATVSGSGLGPYTISGAVDGDFLVITLDALNEGGKVLTSAVWSGAIEKPSGGASWVDLADFDFTDITTASSLTVNASTTLTFQSSSDTIDVYFSKAGGAADATATPTNGTGLVMDGGTDTVSQAVASFDISGVLSAYTYQDVCAHTYAIHFVMEDADFSYAPGFSGLIGGVNSSATTWTTGDARSIVCESLSGGTTERAYMRFRTTNSGNVIASQTILTDRVITVIILGGQIVQMMITSGTTPPTPEPGASTTFMNGGNVAGYNTLSRVYQVSGLRGFVCTLDGGSFNLTRILVQRWQ